MKELLRRIQDAKTAFDKRELNRGPIYRQLDELLAYLSKWDQPEGKPNNVAFQATVSGLLTRTYGLMDTLRDVDPLSHRTYNVAYFEQNIATIRAELATAMERLPKGQYHSAFTVGGTGAGGLGDGTSPPRARVGAGHGNRSTVVNWVSQRMALLVLMALYFFVLTWLGWSVLWDGYASGITAVVSVAFGAELTREGFTLSLERTRKGGS
ncbi:MAG: hypothetical protein AAGA48_11395 [Myxococcota bacterium]